MRRRGTCAKQEEEGEEEEGLGSDVHCLGGMMERRRGGLCREVDGRRGGLGRGMEEGTGALCGVGEEGMGGPESV